MNSLTVGSYITSVRRFYEWTEANKFYPSVAKGIKATKRKQQFKTASPTSSGYSPTQLLPSYSLQRLRYNYPPPQDWVKDYRSNKSLSRGYSI